jgi:predicted tellurium resistance membrane protein TerC
MKRWHWIALTLLTILTLIAEFTIVKHHGDHWWSHIPGFYILWGFIGCVAIIYLSKWFGKYLIQRDEDYYDK